MRMVLSMRTDLKRLTGLNWKTLNSSSKCLMLDIKNMQSTQDLSYDLLGDRYFISINITDYDDKRLNRDGTEKNTEKLIETFQDGVDSY